MTLVQLKHFVVLAEAGSFVQASKVLYLTQPALTRSIQGLEDELGGRLFDRLGRRIALTPFGQEALQRARRLVADAEALRQTGKGLHAGLIGTLRIGLSSGPGALLSVPLMPPLATTPPRLPPSLPLPARQSRSLLHIRSRGYGPPPRVCRGRCGSAGWRCGGARRWCRCGAGVAPATTCWPRAG